MSRLLAPERIVREELIDAYDDHSDGDFANCYRDLRRINRYLGGTSVVIDQLRPWVGDSPKLSVLDVGTGSADIPKAIVQWAARRGIAAHVVCIDTNPKAIRSAREWVGADPRLTFVQASAFDLPFQDRSFDVVTSSLTFHHFSDAEAAASLREMVRVAQRCAIVNDLRRGWVPAALIWLVTRLTGMNRLTRHDAPLSVMRAHTLSEYSLLAERAGVRADVASHPFWRASLVAKVPG